MARHELQDREGCALRLLLASAICPPSPPDLSLNASRLSALEQGDFFSRIPSEAARKVRDIREIGRLGNDELITSAPGTSHVNILSRELATSRTVCQTKASDCRRAVRLSSLGNTGSGRTFFWFKPFQYEGEEWKRKIP